MRMLVMVAAAWALTVSSAAAQAQAQMQDGAPERARRVELAERYLRLSLGDNIRKAFQAYLQDAIAKSDVSPEEREWLVDQLSAAMEEMTIAFSADVRDEVAEIFTLAELQALVTFNETPEGRSIANKTVQLSALTESAWQPHMIKAMESVGAKYCARFGCDEAGAGSGGALSDKSQR